MAAWRCSLVLMVGTAFARRLTTRLDGAAGCESVWESVSGAVAGPMGGTDGVESGCVGVGLVGSGSVGIGLVDVGSVGIGARA
jgi:hypothetical protein